MGVNFVVLKENTNGFFFFDRANLFWKILNYYVQCLFYTISFAILEGTIHT